MGTVSNAPYSLTWSNATSGTYALTAVAADNYGFAATSEVVSVIVDIPPSVTLTNPVNNAVIPAGSISLGASASDADGTVAQVQFFQGTSSLGVATIAPYNLICDNPPSGTYSLTAQATDNCGLISTSSPVNVIVDTPPTVSITSPADNAVIISTQTNLTLTAAAGDSDGTVVQVQFSQGTTSLGIVSNAPYNLVWSNVTAGVYALTACATDNNGLTTTSAAVNLVVTPISIAITNPANDTVLISSQTNLTVMASASDIAGTVTQVEFFQGSTSLGIVTSPPYGVVWNDAVAGNYALTAVATDNNGLAATSPVVNLTITTLLATNNLCLWLKADAISGLTNNAPVGTWPDSSGWNNNDATQVNPSYRPFYVTNVINGYPSVVFTGGQALNLQSFMNDFSGAEAFVVLLSTTPSGSAAGLWTLGDSGNCYNETYPGGDGSIQEDFGSTGPHNLGVPAQPLTQYNVYELSAQNNNWTAWINGLLWYQTSVNTFGYKTSGLGLGGNCRGFNGNIAEVLIFNRALTASERTTVNYYLNGKYGLVAAVPPKPANLTANAISQTQIGLTWNETLTNGGTTQISIERKTGINGTYAQVARIANALSYVDTNLAAGTAYYYRVRAINLNTWSPYSNETDATTLSSGVGVPFGSLALWLKADAGLAQGGTNTPVSLWADQSGNGNNAQQTTGSQRPMWVPNALNGFPVVRYTGGQYLNLPNFLTPLSQAEAFAVVKAAPVGNNYQSLWFLGGSGNAYDEEYPLYDGSIHENFGSSSSYNLGVPAQSLNQYHMYEVAAQSNNWAAWINGVLLFQTSANTVAFSSSPTLSGDYNNIDNPTLFHGDMVEILIFTRVLTADERATVNDYLNGKYGLVLPKIALTSPVNNSILRAPANIPVSASITDDNGISQIQYFQGAGSLGIVPNAPYSMIWSNVTSGSYALTAQSMDNRGIMLTSSVVNVIVDTPPSVVLINPTNNGVFAAGSNISLAANASDPDGTVTQVQFYQGTNSLGIVANAPYNLTWSNVTSGTYALTARATDNNGLVSTSSVVTLIADIPPSVTLTNPANNARFVFPASISLGASSSDADGTVAQVQFFRGVASLGIVTNAPYNLACSNLLAGTYALTAQATDNNGLIATSAVVNITMAGIFITDPTNNLVLATPANIPISAAVVDNMDVSQVQFFQGTTSLGIVASAPYSMVWSNVIAGVYALTAQATGNDGRILTSSAVNVIGDVDPCNTDLDGDGVSDYIEFLQGRNPLVPGAVSDTNGIVNLQIYTPLH